MSDTDSSADEANELLLAAVDTSFLSDNLYKTPSTVNDSKKRADEKTTPAPCATKQPVPKSNRYITEDETFFHSELNVTALVQKHVADKLTNVISSIIEFDDFEDTNHTKSPRPDTSNDNSGVKLLKDFDEVIDVNAEQMQQPIVLLKPKAIKRRKVESEPEIDTFEQLASAVCDPTAFPKEVQQWKGPRKRSIEFQYKKKQDGTLLEKPNSNVNEFTKARNARMWHESKIRKFKKHI
uniref:Protein CUSTOS n=1 Tax=Anopheles stephensi TaxID=30069 RepID=A0A182Y4C8_ANOST